VKPDIILQIEDLIADSYFAREWCVFYPSQIAAAVGINEEVAAAAMTKLAGVGKLRSYWEFFDADGQTVWKTERRDDSGEIDPGTLPVDSPIEAFEHYFEISDEWRKRLEVKKKSRQERSTG